MNTAVTKGYSAISVGHPNGGFSLRQYTTCLKGIVWREGLRFVHQRERFISALVRPLVWLLIFAAGFRQVLGVSIIPPYQTYILYAEYITPGLIAMIQLFNGMPYDLEQFIIDCRSTLAHDPGPAGRERVRLLLERLLNNKDFVEKYCGDDAPSGLKVMYEDRELGFQILAHAVSRPKIFVSIVSGPAKRRLASMSCSTHRTVSLSSCRIRNR